MHRNIYREFNNKDGYDFMKNDKEQFRKQAEFCKFMANPKRLEILFLLKGGEKCVEDIADEMGIYIPNVSQHLSVMKKKGVVESRRDGVKIYYKLSSEKILQACGIMRELMMEQIQKKNNKK
jgi:DNA-binding transcriptional ArsR family regulator